MQTFTFGNYKYGMFRTTGVNAEKNGKETPILGVAQFGEMSYPGS